MTELQGIATINDVLEHLTWMLAAFMLVAGHWRSQVAHEPGRVWMALTLTMLAVGSAPTAILAAPDDVEALHWVWRIPAVAVALTPWALYRYARSVTETSFPAGRIADVLAVVGVAWIVAMPTFPGVAYEPRPWWFAVVPIIGAATWSAAIASAARHVVLATRHRTMLERQRGRLLLAAIFLFAASYLLWVWSPTPGSTLTSNLGILGTVLLLFGLHRRPRRLALMLSPGTTVRTLSAYERLISEDQVADVLEEVLGLLSDGVGLVGIAIYDRDGSVVGCTGHCVLHRGAPRTFVSVRAASDRLRLEGWATPFAPPLSGADYEALEGLIRLVEQALARGTVTRRERDAARRLIAANERLREADELKDSFVSFVSHELRTPLAAIAGYTELALATARESGEQQVVEYLRIILEQGERLEAIVNDLLLLSRLDQGALELHIVDVNLVTLVEAAATSTATQDDVTIELAEPTHVYTDPLRLEQVIANLLANARKYGQPPYLVRSEPVGSDRLRIWVEDRGPGVPEVLVPRLFERFTQAGPSREVSGSGLGLAIVRMLTHALGGEVGYQERTGGGAAFWVEVPLDARDLSLTPGTVNLEAAFK